MKGLGWGRGALWASPLPVHPSWANPRRLTWGQSQVTLATDPGLWRERPRRVWPGVYRVGGHSSRPSSPQDGPPDPHPGHGPHRGPQPPPPGAGLGPALLLHLPPGQATQVGELTWPHSPLPASCLNSFRFCLRWRGRERAGTSLPPSLRWGN